MPVRYNDDNRADKRKTRVAEQKCEEAKTMKLVLLRHGESEWNRKNLFTGWTDVDLSENGRREAKTAAGLLLAEGLDFDLCYTSYLKRAIHTLNIALEEGLNKSQTAEQYGEAQVKIWRRSFGVRPPALDENDERNPARQPQYRGISAAELPLCESLKDTSARTLPYFDDEVEPQIRDGRRVLIAAHGNSLRALIKRFDKLSEEEITAVNIPTGVPLVYTFDIEMRVVEKRYLGDPEAVKRKMERVAKQGEAK
jgi:2,3-bisphosphoglycerate-dependent phosphoglycerate mutase